MLYEFPHVPSTCWLPYQQAAANSFQTIPVDLGQVIAEARSSDAELHHTASWSNSPYSAWMCVLTYSPDGK